MNTEEFELRRGPWTLEEDSVLNNYIASNGEGRWNLLAKYSGLKRTGKSCRLRWLNYLKPDIKRGNLTVQEQLLILELHSKWGNRWSKIAQHLPGRTDNEIKNYWRTRVQKQARQLNIESNSKKFLEAIRCFWMPRLLEQIDQSSISSPSSSSSATSTNETQNCTNTTSLQPSKLIETSNIHKESSSSRLTISSDFMRMLELPEISEYPKSPSHHDFVNNNSFINDCYYMDFGNYEREGENQLHAMSSVGTHDTSLFDCQMAEVNWISDEPDDVAVTLWNMDEL